MHKVVLRDHRHVAPFNEEARDLRIQNKPLWLHQRDVLGHHTSDEVECTTLTQAPRTGEPTLVYRDNLFFDQDYLDDFLARAQRLGKPCRAAFTADNTTFRTHALPLSTSFTADGDRHLADLWYFPRGVEPEAVCEPIVVDFQTRELGFYRVPTYMASESGELVYQVPRRGLIAIDAWVHIFIADQIYGLFGRGARFEDRLNHDLIYNLRVLGRALLERQQVLRCSELVQIGRNCVIHPSAVISGPTVIGDNVTIGAGAVIDNCTIGDGVNVSQGVELMLSTIGDGVFLPFRSATFLTTLMDHTIIAQNTCLQMCVIGRRTFIGAGNTFTDYNLLPIPLRALAGDGSLQPTGMPVLGGAVGHNCRIGSGLVIYPARTIESDVVLFASPERRVIDKHVRYEDSDHFKTAMSGLHQRLYPRPGERVSESW